MNKFSHYFVCLLLLYPVFSAQSLARDLTHRERVVLLGHERTLNILQFTLENIDPSQLSRREWLRFQGLSQGCRPLNAKISAIKRQDDDYPDQSRQLVLLNTACQESVLALTSLYISQRP